VGKKQVKTAPMEEFKRAGQARAGAARGTRDSCNVRAFEYGLHAEQAVSDIGRRLGRECIVEGGFQRWIRAELGEKAVALSDTVIPDKKCGDSAGASAPVPAGGTRDAHAVHRGGLLGRVAVKQGAQREEARTNPGLLFERKRRFELPREVVQGCQI
jgi:hypothetical protein